MIPSPQQSQAPHPRRCTRARQIVEEEVAVRKLLSEVGEELVETELCTRSTSGLGVFGMGGVWANQRFVRVATASERSSRSRCVRALAGPSRSSRRSTRAAHENSLLQLAR